MTDEKTMLKANMLGGMNDYMLEYCNDENVLNMWFTYVVPDGCDEDELMELAESDELFCDCVNAFAHCLRRM